jgi:hypothetical protein
MNVLLHAVVAKVKETKHKIPPSYSRAEEGARSLNGCRDDEC